MGLWQWLGWSRVDLLETGKACSKQFVQDFNGFIDSFTQTVHAQSIAGAAPAAPERDPAPLKHHVLPAAHRLVAIGDVHGDLRKAKQAFRLAHLIDDEDRWIGGETVVVQVGDLLDRGPAEVAILYFLERIKQEAARTGGAVYVLNGNHETMNVRGQFRYATRKGAEGFHHWRVMQQLGAGLKAACGLGPGQCVVGRRLEEVASSSGGSGESTYDALLSRAAAVEPGGPVTRRFFSANPVVLQIGSTVFAHGGVLPQHVEYGIARINQETREWMLGNRTKMPAFLRGSDAVVWTRKYSHVNQEHCQCNLLREALSMMPGAERMVVGHTIQEEGISSACEGRVLRVDVGMSAGCGNKETEVLEILDDKVVRRLRPEMPPEHVATTDKQRWPMQAVASDA